MATFVDQREDEDVEGEEVTDFEDSQEQPAEPEEIQEEQQSDIPDKYQGKSLEDIVRMHQEAEKLLGRQSSEVGELRKTVDTFIQTQLAKEEQAHASTAEEIDFFDDPKRAVEHAIANHPKLKEAEAVTAQMKQSEALTRLKSTHPDFDKIITDQSFLDWVGKSKIRTQLLQSADKAYDFDAADELFSLWKERQNIVAEAAQTETQARKQSVKNASTGNTKGSGESPSRKVYRRADIIKLMQTDPDRYMSLAEEIRTAYAEGRVR